MGQHMENLVLMAHASSKGSDHMCSQARTFDAHTKNESR